jgi:hypothetical protein
MRIPCGCKKGVIRGSFLVLLLNLGWISLFDKLHGSVEVK